MLHASQRHDRRPGPVMKAWGGTWIAHGSGEADRDVVDEKTMYGFNVKNGWALGQENIAGDRNWADAQAICDLLENKVVALYYDVSSDGVPHGWVKVMKEARWVLERLPELGISIDNVTQQLEYEGVEKFTKLFDKLIETLAKMSPLQVRRVP
jgi:hypothetical protein